MKIGSKIIDFSNYHNTISKNLQCLQKKPECRHEKLESKIRAIQAKKISESKKSVSFSTVINEIIKNGIKNFD